MKELDELTAMPDMPLRKKYLAESVDGRVSQILDEGYIDEVEMFLKARYAIEALTAVVSNKHLRDAVMDKLLQNNGELIFRDAMNLSRKNGIDTYDFSEDESWRKINAELNNSKANQKVIALRLKERQKLMLALAKDSSSQAVDEDGQVVPKPKLVKGGGDVITLIF